MFNFKFYLLPLLILSIGLSGCTKLNKDVSKTLSIVIEPAFKAVSYTHLTLPTKA